MSESLRLFAKTTKHPPRPRVGVFVSGGLPARVCVGSICLPFGLNSERVWRQKWPRQFLRTDRFQSTQVHSSYGRREPSPAAPRLGLLAFILKPQEGSEPTRSGYAYDTFHK